jgi:predicted AAA+ superfamily ATPase
MKQILEEAYRLSDMRRERPLPSYRRHLYDDILHSPAKITGIYGARGVGKTTLLLQVLEALNYTDKEKLYISCDLPIFYDISLFDLCEIFARYGGKVIVIDEIHKTKNFESQLKQVYDFLDVRVYFSGSSAIKLTHASFARRYSQYRLPILSFREFLEQTHHITLPSYSLETILSDHRTLAKEIIRSLEGDKILKHYQTFIDVGAYPYYFEDPLRYRDRVGNNINTILYEDLAEIEEISAAKIISLKKLLYTLCASSPMELSLDALAKRIGITKPTLYKYINYLSRAELLHHIMHEAKRFKNIKKPDKLFLNNTNLSYALCLKRDTGTLRESFFISMLYNHHTVHYSDVGDFLVDEAYLFEVGGAKKSYKQIADTPNSFIAADGIEIGFGNKIPLWLFGFAY